MDICCTWFLFYLRWRCFFFRMGWGCGCESVTYAYPAGCLAQRCGLEQLSIWTRHIRPQQPAPKRKHVTGGRGGIKRKRHTFNSSYWWYARHPYTPNSNPVRNRFYILTNYGKVIQSPSAVSAGDRSPSRPAVYNRWHNTTGKIILVWNCHAAWRHHKSTICTSIVYGYHFLRTDIE
jgi:hypothetical protein